MIPCNDNLPIARSLNLSADQFAAVTVARGAAAVGGVRVVAAPTAALQGAASKIVQGGGVYHGRGISADFNRSSCGTIRNISIHPGASS